MSTTIPLTIKVLPSLKRELARAAKRKGLKPSAAARAFIEEGIYRSRPGALLGAGAGSAHLAPSYDPEAPAYPLKDWKVSGPL